MLSALRMTQALAAATFFLSVIFGFAHASPDVTLRARDAYETTCEQIKQAISSASDVYFPLEFQYGRDIAHWAVSSTNFGAACSVEPGTAQDVGIILQILGNTTTPFAVKGGGHASNPGWSSTPGVQIAMSRFGGVNYDPTAQTAEIGAGLIWDDVYAALEPFAVNVVGGRVTGVGVAGFTLGGGYSWKTNQYGLTIDTAEAFELVLPNGTVSTITQSSYPDLFFGLKGGFNNFDIVTKFTLQTFPQTEVWVCRYYYHYNFLLGQPGVSQLLFYDYPTPPDGIFDDFLAIPHFTEDVSTRSFSSLVLSSPANATAGYRAIFHTVSLLQYSPSLIEAILNETTFWGERLSFASGTFISYDVEPFLPSLFSHASSSSAAYPPTRSQGLLPLNIYYAWGLEAADDLMHASARQSAAQLTQVAVAEGQDVADAPLYGNYAIFDTPLSRIYGDNLATLQSLKAKYDPGNVMGLAGGWKL
ncbi:Bifunctional solanapyrone synthase [Grifola frondosa]|uniref:Bifunctional solanapyrone synthase n=1 Tax=Grifola frondosa TaxID=5627 RepID=A0A1C7MJH4_GRIFR|nr:Bifunctional solanapyrone synthase [Grifola frondosa]